MIAAARGLGCHWNGRRARVSSGDRPWPMPASPTPTAATCATRLGADWDALQQATALQRGVGRLLRPLPGRDRPRRRHARPADEPVGLRRADSDSAGGRRPLYRLARPRRHRRRRCRQHATAPCTPTSSCASERTFDIRRLPQVTPVVRWNHQQHGRQPHLDSLQDRVRPDDAVDVDCCGRSHEMSITFV